MISSRAFYMIRHGESEANLANCTSGHMDVALTRLGREQAAEAGKMIASLPAEDRPLRIVHSHLARARDTAILINESLGLPMTEDPAVCEQGFGAWEGQSWDVCREPIYAGQVGEGGESIDVFASRIRGALNAALEQDEKRVLIVCHGGVFRAFGHLYGQTIVRIENCRLHRFTPADLKPLPWRIETYDGKSFAPLGGV